MRSLYLSLSPVEANSSLNESNEELRMKHSGVYIFVVLFRFLQGCAIEAEIDFISGGSKTKNIKCLAGLATDRPRRYRLRLVNLGDHVER